MAIRKSGYVALLDVLGFSERVSRDRSAGGLDSYIDTVVTLTNAFEELGTILFSDTVVLYTFNDEPSAFDQIITLSSELLFALLMADVPVRGAISHGDFLRSDQQRHGTVLAGRPIIEAHHYESQLQWIGIMLAPSLLQQVTDIPDKADIGRAVGISDRGEEFNRAHESLRIQHHTRIPLESPSGRLEEFDGFAVVPIAKSAETLKGLRDSMD